MQTPAVFDGNLGVRSANRLNVLIQTSMRVVAEKSLSGLLQTVAEAARYLTDARVSISGYGYANGQFVVGGASRAEGSPRCPDDRVLKIERGGVYLDLLERQPTLRLTDEQLQQHSSWWGLPANHTPLRGLLGARLVDTEGRPHGLLMVSDKDEGDFTEEDEALLQQLAVMTSLALQHIDARTDAERHTQEARDAETAQRESQRKLTTLLRNLPGMAYRCFNDRDWTMEFVSDGCLTLTGYESVHLITKNPVSYSKLICPEDRDHVWTQIQRAIAEKRPFEVEYRLHTATGEEKWCWEQGVGIYSNHGDVEAIEGFITDITRLKRAEADLTTLADTLERRVAERTAIAERRAAQLRAMAWEVTQAEQRERRRLAQVLHDHLQQLLVASRLKVSLLGRHISEENSSSRIQELEDLINQAINQSRSLTAELSPAVLYEAGLIAALDWLAQEMFAKHQLRVVVRADHAAEPTAEDTRVLLFATTRELLFNVVKHAQVESALVLLSPAGADQVRLEVIDEGVGFDPTRLDTMETSPSGFGLFSIRKRLELLGGQFEVESAPDRGTHVTILAPCHSPPPAGRQFRPTAVTIETPPLTAHVPCMAARIRVLLADDHAIVRQGLASRLSEEPDIEVAGEASDGEEAVDMALRLQPDVVVMDLVMPKIDGIEATRRIVNQLPQTRVIGLSMHEEIDLAAAMRSAGAPACYSKNLPAELLVDAIRQHAPASGKGRR